MELWFSEDFTGGSRFGARVTQVLESCRSEYQQIDVLQTEAFGKMLVIDGKVQVCELDEFVYHEMMAHPALLSHPKPKRVLIAGGGDGGVVRECLRHEEIEELTLVEIDKMVIQMVQKHIPVLSSNILKNPKVRIKAADAAQVVREARNMDVILVDSSDPVGPSEALFKPEFYDEVFAALTDEGVTCMQAGSPFLGLEQVARMVADLKRLFPVVHLLTIPIPTYPGGTWCLALACKKNWNPRGDGGVILRERFEKRGLLGQTRYLSPGMLGPCFEVAPFLKREVRKYLGQLTTV